MYLYARDTHMSFKRCAVMVYDREAVVTSEGPSPITQHSLVLLLRL